IDFAERLNIFTGDNGLGKTFILDTAWWALTGDWAGPAAWPQPIGEERRKTRYQPQIKIQLVGENGHAKPPIIGRFDVQRQEWIRPVEEIARRGLIIYARVDGGLSVWDLARTYMIVPVPSSSATAWSRQPRASFHFTADTLWNGLSDSGATLCN